jgi:hypothetical protein
MTMSITTTSHRDIINRLKQPKHIQTLIYLASFAILSACSPFLSRVSLLCLLNLVMMSLVGQEVDIHKGGDNPMDTSDLASMPEDTHHLGNDNNATLLPGACVEDVHLPPSPAGPAERLFFTEMLSSDSISATALAQQIHQSHRSFMQSVTSVVTADDFVTARGGGSLLSENAADFDDDNTDPHQNYFSSNDDGLTPFDFDDTLADENSPFDSDVLAFTKNTTSKSLPTQNRRETEFHDTQQTMSTATETTMHIDPAEKAYDAAKGVWAWGKGVFVMKHFLGIAEAFAGKAASMAGSTLEDLDHSIMPRLQEWDDSLLNPALQAVVNTILGAMKKSEDIFKPVVFAILKPIGIIKEEDDKKKSSEPEFTAKPTMVK